MNILIVDNEKEILELLTVNLIREGHTIYTAEDGYKAWNLFQKESIDLGIFEVTIPRIDGFQLLKKIRERSDMPVIFLSAQSNEMYRVLGLSIGADDYLVKPFSVAELKARIQVQIRHLNRIYKNYTENSLHNKVIVSGNITLNIDEAVCYKEGELIHLGAKEFFILKFFMENQGRIFTKKQLYNVAWKEQYLFDENTVMVHLSRLRSKIENNPKKPQYITTVKGIGYKFG